MSVLLAVVFGLLAAIAGYVLLSVGQAALLGGAVMFAAYRAQARYFAAAMRNIRHVVPADAVSVLVTLMTWLLLRPSEGGLTALCFAWLAGSAAATALSLRPFMLSPAALGGWFRTYWRSIRVLWAESSILDLANYAVPYTLAATLDMAHLAVYLAASSLLVPVRLVLVPMRPIVAKHEQNWHAHPARIAVVVGGGVFLGLLAYACLLCINSLGLVPKSTIHAIATSYAVAMGVFVSVNFVSTYFYYVARVYAPARALLLRRVVTSSLAIVVPLLAAFFLGLSGALWARIIINGVDALIILLIVRGVPPAQTDQPMTSALG